MTLIKELKALLAQLGNAKFLAHFFEPLLLWGIFIGVLAWMVSVWVLKDRKAQICSLLLMAVSAFCIFPLMHYRKKAAPLDAPSSALMNKQNERRKDTTWVYYGFGSLAVLGLVMTGEGKGKAGTAVTLGLAAGGLVVSIYSLWLHEKETVIFHPDATPVLKRPAR